MSASRNSRAGRMFFYALLAILLLVELLLTVYLRFEGWSETVSWLQWIAALSAALIPLAIAAIVLFRKGFRFRITGILAAVTCFALFLTVSVSPLLKFSRERHVATRLQDAGVENHTRTKLIPFEGLTEATAPRGVQQQLPAWLQPLAGNLAAVPRDAEITCVTLFSDMQIAQVIDLLSDLPNLRHIELLGLSITDKGLTTLINGHPGFTSIYIYQTSITSLGLRSLERCRDLQYLHLHNQTFSDISLQEVAGLRSLSLWVEGGRVRLASNTLNDIAGMPQLQNLMVLGYKITDAEAQSLAQRHTLRHLILRHTGVTGGGEERLRERLPRCRIDRN